MFAHDGCLTWYACIRYVLADTECKLSVFLSVSFLPAHAGDPPENARRFMLQMRQRKAQTDWLRGVRFAVLGASPSRFVILLIRLSSAFSDAWDL